MRHIQFPAFAKAVLILLLSALLLTGCSEPGETTPPTTTEAPAKTYTVRFYMGGILCSEQVLEEGTYPAAVAPSVQGLQFLHWLDEKGNEVDPTAILASQNVTYTAAAYPQLSGHGPFLAVDEAGNFRPDAPLTAQELGDALATLAAAGAEKYFPGMPLGSQKLEQKLVKQVLSHFYGESAVETAFPDAVVSSGEEAPAEEKDYMLRGEFAAGMCSLLGYDLSQNVQVEEGAKLPLDISNGREDYAALLESCLPHTHGETGAAWADTVLPTRYAPGFVNINGWLYYVQEDGYFLRDGSMGKLKFGADGRYTSGDLELDALVADIWDRLIRENPGVEGLDLLRKGFEYCRDGFTYLRRSSYAKGATGWEVKDAKDMFTTLRGNCYNYAAAFWAVAQGLGYEARAISGTVTQTNQPHGWVEIVIDGVNYIFDCEWEMAYRVKQNRFDMDMFMLTIQEGKFWNYKYK